MIGLLMICDQSRVGSWLTGGVGAGISFREQAFGKVVVQDYVFGKTSTTSQDLRARCSRFEEPKFR